MLRGDSRPTWLKYETVVRYLAEFAVYQPDEPVPDHPTMLARFHRLWLACENGPEPSTPEPAPQATPPETQRRPAPSTEEIGGDPPPRNTRFVGREHQLRAIHEILRTGAPTLTLTGIGGVGKTQLAAEYVYRFRDEYDLIWWVPAEHMPPMRAALAELGTHLHLPHSHTMQHPPAQVLEALHKNAQLWLLVFDNAKSPSQTPLIRSLGTGKMLVTSRDPDWAQFGPALDIGVFERQESIELLRVRALIARSNLARDLYGLGRYREALDMLGTTLPIYREVVGDKHAGVLTAIRVQVMTLRKLGRTADAVALARENHHDAALWFGHDHEYTLAAGISLVNTLLAAGDLGNATIQASGVLVGCERVFGDMHPTTLAMLVNSAAVLRALGDMPEARRRDERAMIALGEALGDQHPYTLCARHNFAVDLALLGFEGRSLDEFKLVHENSGVHRDPGHPDHLACEINIALARIAIGGPAAGQQALTRATAALAAQLGTEHPAVLAARKPRWVECDIEPPAT